MCFNDEKVHEVTESDIKKLTGGGEWHSAYILLYRSKDGSGKIVSP